MMRISAGFAGLLALLVLAVAADPAGAEPVEAGFEAGFTTQLQFSYQSRAGDERARRVYLWYPAAVAAKEYKYGGLQDGQVALDATVLEGRHPLIIFSHGFRGAADQTIFLMEALARAGYVVAALHHDDAMPNQHLKRVELPNFVNAKAWDDGMFLDRKEDMSALLDFLLNSDREADSFLFAHLRRGAIGIAGHSLGGYTALGMAGARPAWKDDRISAALLLSPYIQPFYFNGDLKAVNVPVMVQGGTLDIGITPFLKSIYKRLSAPKYYLVLKKVGHYGWTNLATIGRRTTEVLREGSTKLMADYAVAFFDQHLKGQDRRAALHGGDNLHRWLASPE